MLVSSSSSFSFSLFWISCFLSSAFVCHRFSPRGPVTSSVGLLPTLLYPSSQLPSTKPSSFVPSAFSTSIDWNPSIEAKAARRLHQLLIDFVLDLLHSAFLLLLSCPSSFLLYTFDKYPRYVGQAEHHHCCCPVSSPDTTFFFFFSSSASVPSVALLLPSSFEFEIQEWRCRLRLIQLFTTRISDSEGRRADGGGGSSFESSDTEGEGTPL